MQKQELLQKIEEISCLASSLEDEHDLETCDAEIIQEICDSIMDGLQKTILTEIE